MSFSYKLHTACKNDVCKPAGTSYFIIKLYLELWLLALFNIFCYATYDRVCIGVLFQHEWASSSGFVPTLVKPSPASPNDTNVEINNVVRLSEWAPLLRRQRCHCCPCESWLHQWNASGPHPFLHLHHLWSHRRVKPSVRPPEPNRTTSSDWCLSSTTLLHSPCQFYYVLSTAILYLYVFL